MTPFDGEMDFSPASVYLLQMAAAAQPKVASLQPPSSRVLVRYLMGILTDSEANQLEIQLVSKFEFAALLAQFHFALEEIRTEPWDELAKISAKSEMWYEVRDAWMEFSSEWIQMNANSSLTLLILSSLFLSGDVGSRIARGILSQIQDPSLASARFDRRVALRAPLDRPHLEGFDSLGLGIQFDAQINAGGALCLEADVPQISNGEHQLCIAFEVNRQWLGLGAVSMDGDHASLTIEGFGALLGLTEGILPPDIFALRLDAWPSVCGGGAMVVQEGGETFAEVLTEPKLEAGLVSLEIRLDWLSQSVKSASEIELWFGSCTNVWQLLGRWSIPPSNEPLMTLSCGVPKVGPAGIVFPAVLKLSLR